MAEGGDSSAWRGRELAGQCRGGAAHPLWGGASPQGV